MSSKSQASYVAVLRFLRNLVPDRQRTVITDFERALQNAIRDQYPSATLKGCWFHYCQAVWRNFVKLGLLAKYEDVEGRRVLKMILALPLLPSGLIGEGLASLDVSTLNADIEPITVNPY
jgi:hypothetical protein